MKKGPKLIISGAPASGKGTQCEYIKSYYNVIHLSTGDILRTAITNGTSYGLQAQEYMNKGQLVPDDLIIQIILNRLQQSDIEEFGCLLDGFPRTSAQAIALINSGFQCDCFIQLNVDDNLLIERVIGRRMDPITGKIYHLKYSPPSTSLPNYNEIMNRLIQRSDDTEEKVKYRIEAYHANLQSILTLFMNNNTNILTINGNKTPQQIWSTLQNQLNRCIRYEIIFILGGPGSGKGTLCTELLLELNNKNNNNKNEYCHISAGDLLREELQLNSEISEIIRKITQQGSLVPANIVINLLLNKMNNIFNNFKIKKFLIDGFPRNYENLMSWYEMTRETPCHIDYVLSLQCTEDIMKERILKRSKILNRLDDNEITLLKRFHTFISDTQPVLASYDRLGKLRYIDSTLTPQYMVNEALSLIQSISRLSPFTRTFGLIKPDVITKGNLLKILQLIQQNGLIIITIMKIIQFNQYSLQQFYSLSSFPTTTTTTTSSTSSSSSSSEPLSQEFISFMTSSPCIVMILEGVNAIETWKNIMGSINPQDAQATSPSSIRAVYGTDTIRNAVHGSDDEYSALREIDFFFSPTGDGISTILPYDQIPSSINLQDIEEYLYLENYSPSRGGSGGGSGTSATLVPPSTSYEYSFGGLPLQETYAMIKPYTAQLHSEEILSILKGHGYTIQGQIMISLTSNLAEEFYIEHRNKSFYSNLIKYMTSKPIIGLKLLRHGAIPGWRFLMGPTDRTKALNERELTSIRALYGIDGTKNAVHGSDSRVSAYRELQYFFTFGSRTSASSSSGISVIGGNLSPTRQPLPPLHHIPSTQNQSPTKKSTTRIPPMSRVDVNLMQNYNLHEVNPVMGPLLSKMMISRPKDVTEFAINELKKIQETKKKLYHDDCDS